MKKLVMALLCLFAVPTMAFADTYTVKSGDSMWKIAVKYQIGLREIIGANPQIKNPSLIYPGQSLNIPNIDSVKTVEREVIRLCNIERQKAGLAPLTENWELSRVARDKSMDMAQKNYFSHTSPTYGSPFDMMKAYGISYRSAGENIAKGQTTAQQVVNSWMNSSGHRANILSSSFTQIGVGYYATGHHWTQMFISK
ncbi:MULTISPECIES: SafA/ExsA family spore coat assembly protein [Bacillaceae]|uniref:SafA/ExsA family spore coat assembly protein n=1 Tax=Bacillaceae TaxID=186817 RepID=UPI001E4C2EC0|nr:MULTISPECIES: SafA/ExsA family spore coat assembly protein [Bacillaceae]MCE4050903.1 SafA/ExsA family spore coat assembly protein [Bacillus sp. Au-Bac7]MCM3029357.1 SafA/ExsA family spore coat assembly protein [Niallia sp. MER 6]MDL0434452.1 SafA/ExsA family spore coat assembly protein [Niallia sp. SS-2023]UPO88575.1 SafA/ExsA family spore coat assembly protein [Niallia sp. Man26]